MARLTFGPSSRSIRLVNPKVTTPAGTRFHIVQVCSLTLYTVGIRCMHVTQANLTGSCSSTSILLMCTPGLQLQSQQIMLAASGIVGLFTAGLVQLAVAPHSLANMVTVVLITVPNADLECLSSLACVTNLTSLAAHQPTNFTNSLHNLLHLCITDATCDTSHIQQVSALILFGTDSALTSCCIAPPAR